MVTTPHEEWHVTVKGASADEVLRWRATCATLGIKPLWIELATFERQLMCAARFNVASLVAASGWEILRIKHEVQPTRLDISTFDKPLSSLSQACVYHECHIKFDGPFRPSFPMASRDLLREHRWYATFRQHDAFDPTHLVELVTAWAALPDGWRGPSVYAGHEYEAALLDTNPDLDRHWSGR